MVSASFYDHKRYDPDRLFNSGRVVGFFNNQAYHTCVVTLSYVTNALLQAATGGTHHTEVTNHPFPRQTSQMVSMQFSHCDVFQIYMTFFEVLELFVTSICSYSYEAFNFFK